MNYLAIDTSASHLSVIVKKESSIKEIYSQNCGTKHSTSLMPAVEESLISLNASLDDLDFIACVVGAGSFTGIRIGVSTAKAFCQAKNLPCLKITSFDTLAYNICSGRVLAVIDAKHDSYYVCGYEDKKVVFEPKFVSKEELCALASEYTLVSSDDIDFKHEKVDRLLGLKLAIDSKLSEITSDLSALEPLYIRKSQAEEGR